MAIKGERVTVTDAVTLLSPNQPNRPAGDPMTASLLNLGPSEVDLGGPGVTFGTGYPLGVGAAIDVDLMVNEVLFAVADTGQTTVIAMLKLRQGSNA